MNYSELKETAKDLYFEYRDKEEKIMNYSELKEMTKSVNDHWGCRMPLMACEECGELIQAVSKMERRLFAKKPFDDEYENLVEEIGDVFITMGALMNHYCITADEIVKAMNDKLTEERTV